MEKDRQDFYIIYKVENTKNGEVYIGTTTKSIEERKKDHLQKTSKSSSTKFHKAICTSDINDFNWEQIDTATTLDELAHKEKSYIVSYNSKENGYNTDEGGGFKKTIYQYSVQDGSLIGTFNSLEKAGKVVNTTKQHISRACLSINKTYKGYYWSYDYVEPFVPDKDERKKKVLYYDFTKETTQEFNSVAEASKITGVSKSCIARFCRGDRKPPNNICWEYK